MSTSALVALFLAWTAKNRRPRTVEFYRWQLGQWLKLVGEKPVSELVALDLVMQADQWHRWVAVQRLFNWAVKVAKVVPSNPFLDVEKPKLGSRKRTLSNCQLVELRRRAASDFRAFILACQETACRPQEGRALLWDWLQVSDLKKEFWHQVKTGFAFFILTEYKSQDRRQDGGPPRVIPVSPRLGRLLFRIWEKGNKEGEIFRTRLGNPWQKNSLICRMKRLRKKLGAWVSSCSENLVLYTLRHTAATAWAAAGVPGRILGELLGQRNLSTTQRYLHLERYRQLEAIRKLWARRDRPGGEK